MFSAGDLTQEIKAAIDRGVADNGRASAAWVVQAVLAAHPIIEGPERDFYTLCAAEHVRDEVRAAVRRHKPAGAVDPQIMGDMSAGRMNRITRALADGAPGARSPERDADMPPALMPSGSAASLPSWRVSEQISLPETAAAEVM